MPKTKLKPDVGLRYLLEGFLVSPEFRWHEIHINTVFADFRSQDLDQISKMPIVPVRGGEKASMRHLPPTQCFFGTPDKGTFHSRLFVFIDFGSAANTFLSACGAKRVPSVEEIAQILLSDPSKFYELSEGPAE